MSNKKTHTNKSDTKKIRFRQFLEIHASLMPAVQHHPGSPAFYDLMRLWNSLAFMFPEKCDNILVYPVGENPKAMPNDLKLFDALKTLEGRPLENLPDELRSVGYQNRKKTEEAQKEIDKEKAIQRKIENVQPILSSPSPHNPPIKPESEPEPDLPKEEDDKDINVPSHVKGEKVNSGRVQKPN